MKMHLYRDHLRRELAHLPDYRAQEIQSYVLTTAILARRIDDRLGGRLQSESVEPRHGSTLNFRQLVDLLIHYCRFNPDTDATSLGDSKAPAEHYYFRVYSPSARKKHDAGALLAIRLSDYFAIVGKIAGNDIFVLRHLLAATVTRIRRTSSQVEPDHDDLQEIVDAFDDVLRLMRLLTTSQATALREIPFLASDIEFTHQGPGPWDLGQHLVASERYRTLGSLINDYGVAWCYPPFPPRWFDGVGYCLLIEMIEPDFGPMALPFSVLDDAFREMTARLADA